MPTPPAPSEQVFPDRDALSRAAARYVIDTLDAAVAARGRASLALAGGSTPLLLYRLLAGPFRDRIAWPKLYVFWGDERYVPPTHPASNYGAAYEALLRHVPLTPAHLFPMPTHAHAPADAADAYAATLHHLFAEGPTFDLTLLGLGADGHTASLFPGHPLPPEGAWVEAVTAPATYDVRPRLTLTLPALNRSRRVCFLVAGADKNAPLRAILDHADPALPAAHVRAREALTWFVDEAAHG